MKKLLSILMLAAVIFSFSSCKKGEEDPAISLASRKARLTGTWNISAGNWTIERYNSKSALFVPGAHGLLLNQDAKGSISTTTYSFADGKLTETDNDGDVYIYEPYEYTMTFNSDNTFEITEHQKYTFDNGYREYWYTYKGFWSFLDGNDELGVKDKQRVLLQITEETYKSFYHSSYFDDTDEGKETYEGSTNNNTMILNFKELSKKEIKIVYDTKNTDEDGDYKKVSGEVTFTAAE